MLSVKVRLEDIVGSGKVRVTLPSGKAVDARIPDGFEQGQQLRLKGLGGEGTPAGDAILILTYEPHTLFRPEGHHLRIDLPITLDEAVLGGKVEAETIDGPVMLTVPRGASSGQTLRLKGRGLKGEGGKRGDQHVVLKIVMPPKIDDELASFMEKWRQDHGYDARRGK
jgi:DnaJ-class molecular chaperone